MTDHTTLSESLPVLAARVGEMLRARGQTVSVVESSAGGLVSAALLAIPGASAYFRGGAVVYSRRAGRALLGLTADDMAGMRGETEPYALLIAGRMRDTHHTTWGIAESGAAGPSPSPYGDVPGRVCLAIVGATTLSRTIETGDADRPANMDLFARHLLTLFEQTLRTGSS
ncbi:MULTISPECIES: CinA family protein [unclassified Variovorax]|jgi:PncC family amidohydrolase|uniref:CinA family protein n=1 Tax=unclassified Variovorax TaxID=663243 RepID=UPI000F7DFD3F|nr:MULTISPECIES: CinA family protein [unclassified Variovorax]RSZ39651.1 CinA family protein [Variovorax sp. 553]RSZ40644.1 CinA family protein [Variovorax sp. 679]